MGERSRHREATFRHTHLGVRNGREPARRAHRQTLCGMTETVLRVEELGHQGRQPAPVTSPTPDESAANKAAANKAAAK